MSDVYLTPGVYVKDLTYSGPRPIESLATSVLAIVGLYDPNSTEKGPTAPAPPKPGEPTLVTNWTQFGKMYGGIDKAPPGTYLHQAMHGYFLNGGRQAYVVGLPVSPTIKAKSFEDGINTLEACEDVTLLACPDVFAIVPPAAGTSQSQPVGTNQSQLVLGDEGIKSVQGVMIDHCSKMGDRIALLDMQHGLDVGKAAGWADWIKREDRHAAAYYPWIGIAAGRAQEASSPAIYIPPSGHIAGVFARVDFERGVHKAPANEVVRGAYSLEYNATRYDQETLNPAGVNCIRAFPGQGIRVWGARTLTTKDPQWRYINVQRLFANIGDSIAHNTRWVVFEPNDPVLWAAIRRDITAYLTRLWREGALFGSAPEEAFYVKCDAETNPPEVIDAGQCIIEVGIAPVRPAEFVVLKIGQWQGGSTTTAVG